MESSVDSGVYVKDDCIEVECIITIPKPSRLPSSIVVPLPDSLQQFGSFLLNEECSDVTFEVDGKTFSAHKLVLAVRSPVFKAQFFGEMKETRSQIPVLEIKAPIFKAMLHFIYTDSLPKMSEIMEDYSDGDDGTAIFQHLLVAADRYGLERLKILCAEMLFKNIDISNAVTILALAEQHNCSQLKNACLDLIATRHGTIRAITMAGGFEHLLRACPSTLKDLIEKFGMFN